MLRFGYRCEMERYSPSFLVESAIEAENHGFEFLGVADHFHPWFHRDGAAAQAWVYMASAAALTKRIRLGTSITTPTYRYHPAIVAQTFATLGSMYPGRIQLGVGTGEAMNEVPLGFDWPPYAERFERLEEAVRIIRLLWTKDFVTYSGKYYKLRDANLYTKPKIAVPIYVAGSGKSATSLAGRVGDGFICGRDAGLLTQLQEAATKAGREVRTIRKRTGISLSYDEDYESALRSIARWAIQGTDDPGLSKFMGRNLYDPREMDRIAQAVDLRKYASRWLICTDLDDVVKEVEKVSGSGFDEIEIYSVSPDERSFLTKFGTKYLPYLRERYSVE